MGKATENLDQDTHARLRILRTARGFRAWDAKHKLVGIYPTAGEGIVALLERTPV